MRQRAFTLVEMLTVVSLIGVAGGLAAFTMSEQIADARAKAEAKTVLQDLRAEHRASKEQMFGLKIHSSGHVVTYQNTRGEDCTDPVGDARTETYNAASLTIVSPATGACFNARGEPDPPGSAGNASSGLILGNPKLNLTAVVAPPPSPLPPQPTEVVLAIEATLSNPGREYFVPLRIDRAGIVDVGASTMSTTEAAARKSDLLADPVLALDKMTENTDPGVIVVETTLPLEPTGVFAPPKTGTNCVDADGLPIPCPAIAPVN